MLLARVAAALVVASCFLLIAAPVGATSGDRQREHQASAPPPNRSADFLFGRPRGSISVRGDWVFAGAGSDLFDFVTRHLTLEKSDFNMPGIGADVTIALSDRLAVQGGLEFARASRPSEYRDFVDSSLNPIEQFTALRTTHIFGGVRYALVPPGYRVSRLAWIPRRVVPSVGAGAGAVFYQFRQSGDFVDFVDFSVFPDTFRSQGWAPAAHVYGALDVQLYRGLYATMQGRYTKASATLSSDFIDFEPIDLSGFRVSAGVNILF